MSETAIGIDIGGSHVQCGIICDDRVLVSETIKVKQPSLYAILPALETLIESLLERWAVPPATLSGMAVGICAVVSQTGSLAATNGKYDDGIGFNFGLWAEQRFGLRCVVENDTRLALLGERHAGAAQGLTDVVLVTLGTGIGGAVLLGGRLLRSEGGRAGGLAGHLGVDWQGKICSCGNRGCAEAEASTASLPGLCRDWAGFAQSALSKTKGSIDFRRLFSALDRDDSVAQEVLNHCIGVWSALAVSLVHAYDPQAILFGGGVMHRQAMILPAIRDHVARHAWMGREPVAVLPASLGAGAALFGALPLLRGNS